MFNVLSNDQYVGEAHVIPVPLAMGNSTKKLYDEFDWSFYRVLLLGHLLDYTKWGSKIHFMFMLALLIRCSILVTAESCVLRNLDDSIWGNKSIDDEFWTDGVWFGEIRYGIKLFQMEQCECKLVR